MATGQYTAADVAAPSQQGAYSMADVDLVANPNREGVYQMKTSKGDTAWIPYSNIQPAWGQGHFFANSEEQARFEKDSAADRSKNDPYLQSLTPSAGGIAQGAINEAGNMAKGAASMFKQPENAGEALLGPALPAYRAAKGYIQSAGQGLGQASNYATSGQPVRAAATVLGAVNPLSSGQTAGINQAVDQRAPISEVIGRGAADIGALAAPEVGAAIVRSGLPSAFMNRAAEGFYGNALKPSTTLTPAARASAISTGLENSIPVSAAGVEKLGNLVDDLNQKIAGEIAQYPNRPISPAPSLQNLQSVRAKFQNQVNPTADVNAVNAAGNEFADQFRPGGPYPQGTMPASAAQEMKQGTYSVLKGKYGEQGSAAVEAQKALARGLKEEIANQFPEIGDLNAAESRLLNLGPLLERAVNRISNNHTIGIGGPIMAGGIRAATGSTGLAAAAGVMKSVFDIPAVKSQVAIALSKGAKIPYPQALARVSAYSASLGSAVAGSQANSTVDNANQPVAPGPQP